MHFFYVAALSEASLFSVFRPDAQPELLQACTFPSLFLLFLFSQSRQLNNGGQFVAFTLSALLLQLQRKAIFACSLLRPAVTGIICLATFVNRPGYDARFRGKLG